MTRYAKLTRDLVHKSAHAASWKTVSDAQSSVQHGLPTSTSRTCRSVPIRTAHRGHHLAGSDAICGERHSETERLLEPTFRSQSVSVHTQAELDAAAHSLNGRPRQTLEWMTPSTHGGHGCPKTGPLAAHCGAGSEPPRTGNLSASKASNSADSTTKASTPRSSCSTPTRTQKSIDASAKATRPAGQDPNQRHGRSGKTAYSDGGKDRTEPERLAQPEIPRPTGACSTTRIIPPSRLWAVELTCRYMCTYLRWTRACGSSSSMCGRLPGVAQPLYGQTPFIGGSPASWSSQTMDSRRLDRGASRAI